MRHAARVSGRRHAWSDRWWHGAGEPTGGLGSRRAWVRSWASCAKCRRDWAVEEPPPASKRRGRVGSGMRRAWQRWGERWATEMMASVQVPPCQRRHSQGPEGGALDFCYWTLHLLTFASSSPSSSCRWPLSTKASRQSTLGYTHGSSLSVDGAQATNLMVTQDTDELFIQVRPPCGRNTYVLRLIVLICVKIIMCPRRVPCPSLYSSEGRVTDLETDSSRLELS